MPESKRDFEGMNDAERISPPVSLSGVPYELELRVDAELLAAIRSIESPSHAIRSEIDGSRATITLAGDDRVLDRDFVLELTPRESQRPTACQAVEADGTRYVMATFAPDIAVRREPVEVVFVVDCSGSMGGPSIEEAPSEDARAARPELTALVPTIWARRRIGELEEEKVEGRRGSGQARAQARTDAELVELGKRFGLISSAASYVAVEERAEGERTTERAALRRIPIALTRGWGGIASADGMFPKERCVRLTGAFGMFDDTAMYSLDFLREPGHEAPKRGLPSASAAFGSGRRRRKSPSPASKQPSPPVTLGAAIVSQRADGSWDLDDAASVLGVKRKALARRIRRLDERTYTPLLATLVVLALVAERGSATPTSWKPVLEKARRWLERATAGLTPPAPHGDWEEWARTIVEEVRAKA